MSRAQGDPRRRLDRMSRHQAEFVGLGHHGEDHDHFQHRRVLADTPPRSAAEGELGEALIRSAMAAQSVVTRARSQGSPRRGELHL